MATMNVSLPEQMKDWIESQVATGRYANASDMVRALIRAEQDRQEASVAWWERQIEEGLASGAPQEVDLEKLLSDTLAGIQTRKNTAAE